MTLTAKLAEQGVPSAVKAMELARRSVLQLTRDLAPLLDGNRRLVLDSVKGGEFESAAALVQLCVNSRRSTGQYRFANELDKLARAIRDLS